MLNNLTESYVIASFVKHCCAKFLFTMSRILTTAERVELIDILNASASASDAARVFNGRHPERAHPVNRSTAIRLRDKLHNTGSLHDIRGRGRSSVLENVNVVNNILHQFRGNVHNSIRRVSRELHHSTSTIGKVLKAKHFWPYKFQKHQKLSIIDYDARLNYCNNFIAQSQQNPGFIRNILWTDECLFPLDGSPNKQTYRYVFFL